MRQYPLPVSRWGYYFPFMLFCKPAGFLKDSRKQLHDAVETSAASVHNSIQPQDHGPTYTTRVQGKLEKTDITCVLNSFIPSPSLSPQLSVFPSHPTFRAPSRLECFENLFLHLLLFWGCLANHGDEHRGTTKALGQFPSTPIHRIV